MNGATVIRAKYVRISISRSTNFWISGDGAYLWRGRIPLGTVYSSGDGAFLWRRRIPLETAHSFEDGAILWPQVQSLCNEGYSEGYEVATNTLKGCTPVSCSVPPKMEHTLHGNLPSTRVPLDLHWMDCVRLCENFPFHAKLCYVSV